MARRGWGAHPILLLALLLFSTCTAVPLGRPEGACTDGGGTVVLESSCNWSARSQQTSNWVGRFGDDPVAIIRDATVLPPPRRAPLKLVNTVLQGFPLPSPAAAGSSFLGRPVGLLAEEDSLELLHLQDIRILATQAALHDYLGVFADLIRHGRAYTDNSTFLHVVWWSSPSGNTIWQSTGLLVARSPVQFSAGFSATNATLLEQLRSRAGASTQVPLLLYVSSNVTLGPPAIPEAGLPVNRPLYLVGASSTNTSLDWRMAVNQLVLLGASSNITLDWLVLENLAYGNQRSATVAQGADLSVTANVWALMYPRTTMRFTTRNVTMVHSQLAEIDYITYWATVYRSQVPYFAEELNILKNVLKVEAWKIGPESSDRHADRKHLHLVEMRTVNSYKFDTTYTVVPVVAPPLPLPDVRPGLVTNKAFPLVITSGSAEDIMAGLDPKNQGDETRKHIQVLTSNISWPVGRSAPVVFPCTLMGTLPSTGALPGQVNMDFQQQRGVLVIPPEAEEKQVVMHHLVLKGLTQGPRATSAESVAVPDVWTLLLWAIQRGLPSGPLAEYDYIMLGWVSLVLPAPEFDYIKNVPAVNNRMVIPMSGGGPLDMLMMTGLSHPAPDTIFVQVLLAGTITGGNITLLRDNSDDYLAMPGGYHWPQGHQQPGAGGSLPGWVVAVTVVLSVLAVGLAALGAIVLARRQRRRRQQQAKGEDQQGHGQHASYRGVADPEQGPMAWQGKGLGPGPPGLDQQQQLAVGVQPGASSLAAASYQANPSWQRIHAAISSMSYSLQQRRLMASLSTAASLPSCNPSNSTLGSAALPRGDAGPWIVGGRVEQQAMDAEAACGGPLELRGASNNSRTGGPLQLLGVVGRGQFGLVYRAGWRGCIVAVKLLHLPAAADAAGGDRRQADHQQQQQEKDPHVVKSEGYTALMEAVISTNMSHPNIVQVYTYTLQPLYCETGPARSPAQPPAQPQQGSLGVQQQTGSQIRGERLTGWELRLIMEFCEEGSLRAALDDGRLVDSSTGLPDLLVVLPLCLDVARALLHMHQEQLLHGDLKANNVLLARGATPAAMEGAAGASTAEQAGRMGSATSSGSACSGSVQSRLAEMPLRIVGKVSDFGLSLAMDTDITHVSHMHGGTLTHMAPELLLEGHASPASDVYAFGVLLFEVLTGQRAFNGCAIALLAHQVAHKAARPQWPGGAAVCPALKALAERCWAQKAGNRPCFSVIIDVLQAFMQLTVQQLQEWQGPLILPSCSCRHCAAATAAGAAAAGCTAPPRAASTAAVTTVTSPSLPPPPAAAAAAVGSPGGNHCTAAPTLQDLGLSPSDCCEFEVASTARPAHSEDLTAVLANVLRLSSSQDGGNPA